ncbi:hypothetical protein [Leptothoe sp. PORK10 BA2]|uniref:hypothetical protein n=1 Tax=Leptothoe sp. PORK10 BA2 TaxID=3110254 RepID=UPI002B21BE55|nr:hypothetical protein [Leptothoe sp. PORK10 BA2]MEA5464649.1 hypothetical protein [Leptothoe sp. PORK10 BA2]
MKKPLVAGRIPPTWHAQIQQIQQETGKTQSEIVKDAIGLYLEKTDPNGVASMARRLGTLENQVKKLVQLV